MKIKKSSSKDSKKYYVEITHKPTGIAYSENDCPQFHSKKDAIEYIRERKMIEKAVA